MAQISLFYNAVKTSENTWDREYTAEDFALFFSTLYRNGVVMPVRDAFQIKPASTGGMRVVVSAGAANINGYQFINTEDFAIEIAVASASQSRTDSIGIQHNLGERVTKIYYKQGDVSVTQEDDVWELQLAQINVIRNAIEITASNIKDMRADVKVCGYASPYMDVPVSGLEQQYEDLLAAMYTQFGVDFTTWFEDIKGQLSTDAAGNLQNQINELDSQVTSGISTIDKKIDDVDSSVIHKTGDETVEGLKNFQDGIQSGGEDVLTKTEAEALYPAKSKGTVLWTGLSTLNSSHTITPSKHLSDCQTGWLLIFAPYNGTSAQNYDVTTVFVPKGHTRLTVEQVFNGSAWIVKRFQCTNNDIIGHGSNVGTEQIKAALIEVREV